MYNKPLSHEYNTIKNQVRKTFSVYSVVCLNKNLWDLYVLQMHQPMGQNLRPSYAVSHRCK